jgi:CBS domain-containing protein
MKVAQDFAVEVPLLRYDEKATRARQILRDDIYRELYVHDDRRRLLGYVDITDVLNVTATKSDVTIEGFIKTVTPVRGADPMDAVVLGLRKNATDSIPVLDECEHLIGGILLSEIFPVIITRHRLQGQVRDVMSRSVVTLSHGDPIQKVHTYIVDSGFTAFPVMKKKKLVGIVSRRDLLRDGRWRTGVDGVPGTPVEGIMTTPVFTVSPGDPLHLAAEMMVRHDVSRLPVVEEGLMVGIIDRHDVLKALR